MEVRFLGRPERDPWVGVDWGTDPDWEFRTTADIRPEEVQPRRDGTHFSLRWVLLHLIEETARHAGDADVLREAIDGTVGE